MKLITLYKRNSKGAPQQWSIFVDGPKFWAEYGLVGGTIQADSPTTCKGKNIGKKNETSPEDQARLEAESKIRKQRDKGYVDSIEEVVFRFTPMLSHEFGKHGHKLPSEIWVSPKLDGIRICVSKEGAHSRNGKPIPAAKFICEELEGLFKDNPDLIVDGEIYNHAYKEDFNKIVSLAKKAVRITDEEWADISKNLQLHIFDFYFKNLPKLSFSDRMKRGKDGLSRFKLTSRIQFVKQERINKIDIDDKHEEYLSQGYEGIMARDPNSVYELKRSYNLQKYKNFVDEEFEILDIEEGKGNWEGKAMKMIFRNNDGDNFEAVPKGNEDFRRKLLLDKDEICGKMATVKYQNRTPRPENKPRFGIVTAIRDYE